MNAAPEVLAKPDGGTRNASGASNLGRPATHLPNLQAIGYFLDDRNGFRY
jgi:hypothetical protein